MDWAAVIEPFGTMTFAILSQVAAEAVSQQSAVVVSSAAVSASRSVLIEISSIACWGPPEGCNGRAPCSQFGLGSSHFQVLSSLFGTIPQGIETDSALLMMLVASSGSRRLSSTRLFAAAVTAAT